MPEYSSLPTSGLQLFVVEHLLAITVAVLGIIASGLAIAMHITRDARRARRIHTPPAQAPPQVPRAPALPIVSIAAAPVSRAVGSAQLERQWIGNLSHYNPVVYNTAVNQLVAMNSIPGLRQALKHYDPNVQMTAVRALVQLGDREGLQMALQSWDPSVQSVAVQALAQRRS